MPGSGPDDLNEEPDINDNPPIDPLTSQGFEEVFSLFKTYLKTRLELKGKQLKEIIYSQRSSNSKVIKSSSFFNAELEELVGKIKEANAQ